ncbi:hypothetical protein VDG1235_3277 [Verrucomicrobiia bacterium DG1235]|nr:hypothetical protein VDG1235_3277 [Verrucomicrobiae bacterium DG1235]
MSALKMACLQWVLRNSISDASPATNPPVLASDFRGHLKQQSLRPSVLFGQTK